LDELFALAEEHGGLLTVLEGKLPPLFHESEQLQSTFLDFWRPQVALRETSISE
jgi:hypothetical protein